jgi:hypothetical protein
MDFLISPELTALQIEEILSDHDIFTRNENVLDTIKELQIPVKLAAWHIRSRPALVGSVMLSIRTRNLDQDNILTELRRIINTIENNRLEKLGLP